MLNIGTYDSAFMELRSESGSDGESSSAFPDYGISRQRDAWMNAVGQRLALLLGLKKGWDGYQGGPISEDTARFTWQLLLQIWSPDLPAPDISPMSDEGIMLEWLSDQYELTIEIGAPFEVEYLFECLGEGKIEEGSKTNDFSRLNDFADLIAEAARNQRDQAA